MDEIATIHNYWSNQLQGIESGDPEQLIFEEAAGVDRLKKYGQLVLIDSLVLKYPAYKHDEIFNLSLGLVYQLLAISKERDRVSAVASKLRRKTIK